MESPTLAELQQSLSTRILDANVQGSSVPRFDDGLEHHLAAPDAADLSSRLGVYTTGYPARIREAVSEAFPAIAIIVGDGSLGAMLERYRPHVATGWCNLNSIGERLPTFLETDRLSEELPFLPDLAQLEWRVFESFHASIGEPADLGFASDWELSDWERARIRFQPGVAIVSSAWPIHDLRAARECERSAIEIELVGRPQSVWVYRQGFEVVTEPLDEFEALATHGLVAGRTLGDVMGQLESAGADAGSVLELFSRFAALGVIEGCDREP